MVVTVVCLCVFVSALGLREADVAECVAWMRPFAHVMELQTPVELKKFPSVPVDSAHNIQTHTISLDLLVCIVLVPSGKKVFAGRDIVSA